MDHASLEDLRRRHSAIRAEYDAHFAGQPRITREQPRLADMLDRLVLIVRALETLPDDPPREELLHDARENEAFYRRELDAIAEAQSGGPDALEAHNLTAWVRLIQQRYRRHFGGRARANRDLGLLAELIAELDRLTEAMEALRDRYDTTDLRDAVDSAARNRALYVAERGEIVAARGAGTAEQQADLLAQIANEQFALYDAHLSGKPRLSRRPALAQRIIDNLAQLQDRMELLETNRPPSDTNARNIGIVRARLEAWRQEREAIAEAKAGASFDELVAALGGAANQVLAEYREHFAGHDRRTRDLPRLGRLCDSLYDLARQMDDLDRTRTHASNIHNLSVVLDNLRLYEREYALIAESRETRPLQ